MSKELNLTRRQLQALSMTADGLSYKMIGDKVGLLAPTVSDIMLRARKALKADTNSHAVAIAFRKGIIQ